jgi:hypothetical protein
MFVAIFLTHEYEKTKNTSVCDLVQSWFSDFNETQNPSSGFWGDSRRKRYYSGFQNAFHQFVIYHYWKESLQYSEKIVDSVLMLQDRDGFFAPSPGGGGCWDFDAADILIHCGYERGYRAEDVRGALMRLFNAILDSQNQDGGFCESRQRSQSVVNVLLPRNLRTIFSGYKPSVIYWKLRASLSNARTSREKLYTHWTEEGRFWHQSDLWDTWFRCLALAEIDTTLNLEPSQDKKNWNFQKCIGLGYFNTEHLSENSDLIRTE